MHQVDKKIIIIKMCFVQFAPYAYATGLAYGR